MQNGASSWEIRLVLFKFLGATLDLDDLVVILFFRNYISPNDEAGWGIETRKLESKVWRKFAKLSRHFIVSINHSVAHYARGIASKQNESDKLLLLNSLWIWCQFGASSINILGAQMHCWNKRNIFKMGKAVLFILWP